MDKDLQPADAEAGALLEALRANPAFLPVDAAERAAIDAFRRGVRSVGAGRTLIEEHRRSPWLFTLWQGWAFRYKTLRDGRRQILSFLLPGDLMGLQDEFVEGTTYGVEAATDVTLAAYPREGLWAFFHAQPRLGYAITWTVANEEKFVDDNLVSAGRRSAAERVAMLLLHLYRRAERVGMAAHGCVAFPFSQQHLADALGLSLVHTNKTLRKLERVGLHEIKSARLRLLDPLALQRIADYYAKPMRPVPLL